MRNLGSSKFFRKKSNITEDLNVEKVEKEQGIIEENIEVFEEVVEESSNIEENYIKDFNLEY